MNVNLSIAKNEVEDARKQVARINTESSKMSPRQQARVEALFIAKGLFSNVHHKSVLEIANWIASGRRPFQEESSAGQ